jgi:transcriptional regulator with GAF, ATPase, and Fis domain
VVLAGIVVCVHASGVLTYILTMPDLGLRSAFGHEIRTPPRFFLPETPGGPTPRSSDIVHRIGDETIDSWPKLLGMPRELQAELDRTPEGSWPSWARRDGQDLVLIRTEFQRRDPATGELTPIKGWCALGHLSVEDLVPTTLWFFLKLALFVVGALVFWKRPNDPAASQFFLLCIVTLGAYMGGYHWPHIATQPVLLLGFMVCGVLLPVVSLHFYLVFPRPKAVLVRHPRWTLLAIYGVPVAFLLTLVALYFRARWAYQGRAPADEVVAALDLLRRAIYVYLGVAALWYLASIVALVHSYRTVGEGLERQQVKWILCGAILSLVPIGYSLYLALWKPDDFGAGAATWPMFAASICLTVAFAVSITRYRLMELDQIITSGVGYFLISFGAGVAYYAVVFLGALAFSQVVAGPSLTQALTVSTTALLLMLVLDLARSRVKKVLDRRFSREKYQLDRTLHRMGQAIEQLVDPPALARRLLQASTDLLGVPRGAVYLREGDPPLYRLAGAVGPEPPVAELAPGCPLIEALQRRNAVLVSGRAGDLRLDQRQLQLLGGAVAHGLVHEGRLLALLVLGPKARSYQQEDLHLLAAFAQITVLALESAEGHRTIELLNRDLQAKVEKISEQQRRILALQSQLRKQSLLRRAPAPPPAPAGADAAPRSAAGIVGSSPHVRNLLHLVRKVADNDRTVVLIRGESGTGKELLAQAVHESSPRAGKPFVKVHCAALSSGLLESELFGHVKGAFTGAIDHKTGRFELAHGGTLFLDEIGDISLEVQTKLLRVLQEMAIERVGSSESIKVDVRILAATHQDLEALIQQGRFRLDLFYRLNVFPIVVPPLRERREDIPELAQFFLRQSAQRCRKAVTQIDDDALAALKGYAWPGNIRQLENVIERAVVIAEGSVVTLQELPEEIVQTVEAPAEAPALEWRPRSAAPGMEDGGVRLERAERNRRERERIVRALAAAHGNKAEAARALGLARSTFLSRLKKHGLA